MPSYEIRAVIRVFEKDKERVVVTVRRKDSGEYIDIPVSSNRAGETAVDKKTIIEAIKQKTGCKEEDIIIPRHLKHLEVFR